MYSGEWIPSLGIVCGVIISSNSAIPLGKSKVQRQFAGIPIADYNFRMQRKIFWMVFAILGLCADILLPLWWALAASIPIVLVAWWVAYRSEWF